MSELNGANREQIIKDIGQNLENIPVITFNELDDSDFARVAKIKEITDLYVRRNFTLKVDYGFIPGCGDKKTLFKPGAEKLKQLFGLVPHFEKIDSIVDFKEKLFYYHYCCKLYRNNKFMGECEAIAVSLEKKFKAQLDKGNYGAVNNVIKMAQKRAFVGAILIVCSMSQYFTQDLEDTDEILGISNNSNPNNGNVPNINSNGDGTGAKLAKGEITREEWEKKFGNK